MGLARLQQACRARTKCADTWCASTVNGAMAGALLARCLGTLCDAGSE